MPSPIEWSMKSSSKEHKRECINKICYRHHNFQPQVLSTRHFVNNYSRRTKAYQDLKATLYALQQSCHLWILWCKFPTFMSYFYHSRSTSTTLEISGGLSHLELLCSLLVSTMFFVTTLGIQADSAKRNV